ncbi:hypothetical protein VOLCADRAFT_93011 [Volvox carteri f. nagariensis]|uniref:Uncharacterized protein n=1 Tax=Volvox carteri f. nagariensis TaxID=3068 RepID=D8U138_VOLCA|nr:uncharacterized protein VOLCADRAFT_93011 [Volvox carteri f. nagariensis]EFJ46491.1 hypothetical protein VOLCADRAFT_93011 [Volvox carteri f. nagariensis]|eukprot:XP_002952348.1 hypothetical protein VOLCADRAFT_93011 [Volvox carteri f. nagariensis]
MTCSVLPRKRILMLCCHPLHHCLPHCFPPAWRDLLNEIAKLADLSFAGVPSNSSGSGSSEDSGGDFNLSSLSSLNSLSLNEVGLLMVEDIVSRMSQHWRRAVSQGVQPVHEAAPQLPRDPALNRLGGDLPVLGSLSTVQDGMDASGEAGADVVDAADLEGGDLNPEAGPLPLNRTHHRVPPAAQSVDGMKILQLPPPFTHGAPGDPGGEGTPVQSLLLTLSDDMIHNFATVGSSSGEIRGDEGSSGSRRGRGLLQGPTGGMGGNPMYANAFRLVFGNFFDFVEGARRFIATLAGEARSLLINIHWIRDLAILATAPLDNIINSNWLPLPQSIGQLRSLFETALNDYCTPESLRPSRLVLGEYRRPTFSLAILPALCTISVDDTGRRSIDWERCTPARLRVTITPGSYTGAYYTAPVYTGKVCRYSRAFGTDKTYQTGGGPNSYTFRRSARALFLLPVLNQFFVRGLFTPFVADNLRFGNVTGGPVLDVISADRPTTADGSNAAFILRTPTETAKADERLKKKLIPIRDDEPKRYVPKQHPQRNRGHSRGSAEMHGASAAGGKAQVATTADTSGAQQRTAEALLQQPQRLQRTQPKPLQPPQPAPAPQDSSTAAIGQAAAAGDVSAQTVVPAVVPYHGKRTMAPEAADKEALSSKSGARPPREAAPAAAWNLTYTEWLLDVVDRAFGTSGV